MSRIASDAVALANDGLAPSRGRIDWENMGARYLAMQIESDETLAVRLARRWKFRPYRLTGLAARCLASSNAITDKVDWCGGGSFAEVGTTRHAVKP